MWICPYCGEENYLDDRIGLEDPKCRGCKLYRKTARQVEQEIANEIKDLKTEMIDCRKRALPHIEMIDALNCDLADEKSALKEIDEEYAEAKKELIRLEQRVIYTHHDKALAAMNNEKQKTLLDYIKGLLKRQGRSRKA